jgi:Tripartite tricarboxylate transporter TctB family
VDLGGVGVQNLLQKKDFYAGLAMVLLGGAVTLNSSTYNLGTFMHMGPGMFPFMLGILMTFIGVLIFVQGLLTPLEEGERILPESMEWRGWACILAGPLMFILFGQLFGMVAGTFMCVFVSALGDRTATLKGSAILAACITVAGAFLFSYILKVPFPLFRWGF